ncbi:hypothetical protein LISE100100_00240 [Listeria seeligeri]|uniref:hypothetical protein n=1 Tax=Listeria seeligeri TaxID=1640 RepID=UPI0001C4EC88|nr:hypothetical protein [Listeria seeligeri]CBH27776.1 hypothetical protein lse_1625 [Listeria seeligeri serovar 1/2b str. SLCC3954]
MNKLITAIEIEFVGAVSERKKIETMYKEANTTNERSYCIGLAEGQEKYIRMIERLLEVAKK